MAGFLEMFYRDRRELHQGQRVSRWERMEAERELADQRERAYQESLPQKANNPDDGSGCPRCLTAAPHWDLSSLQCSACGYK